jgi:5-methylcytosine-specific restriction enzyme A
MKPSCCTTTGLLAAGSIHQEFHDMFEPGRVYQRRDLHAAVGGQQQGGISTPADRPLVLLFTGESGRQHGYDDGWEPEGTYRYFGEGQVGDMRFVGGNRAIRDHAGDGKDLHLFAILPQRRGVRYVGQMVCAGYEFVPGARDREGNLRTAIAFRLAPVASLGGTPDWAMDGDEVGAEDQVAVGADAPSTLEALRQRALEHPAEIAEPRIALRTAYRRSAAVRAYVLGRAHGRCEGCGTDAPFLTKDGVPYLEPHHTRRLSDGGPDHPAHVTALCPNCHRRVHHGADGHAFNEELKRKVRLLEK